MKHILHKVCLALLLFVVGVCSGWADEVTINFGSSNNDLSQAAYTDVTTGITFTAAKGGGTNAVGASAGYNTIYGGNTLTIAIPSSISVTSLVFSPTSTSYPATNLTCDDKSTMTDNSNNGSSTWSGNATGKSLVFSNGTNSSTKSCRLKSIAITYTKNSGGGSGDGGGSGSGDTPTPTPSASTGYFIKIASEADIVDGGQYIIVREESATQENSATQYAAGINEGSAKYISVNEFATTGYYYGEVNASGKPYVYTLIADAQNAGYYFFTNGDKYLNVASSGTELMLGSKSTYSDWNIEITNQKNVNIVNKSSQTRQLKYNTGSPARFANYASTTGSVVTLYRYVPSVSVSNVGYATYYNEFAYVMPAGLEGKIMEYDKEGNVVSSVAFDEGDVVPANTALLLKGSESVYLLPYTTTAPDETTAEYCTEYNLLKGSLVDAPTTGGSKYYKFAQDPDDGLGWYWGADNGAAFTNPAHKAYLAIPEGGNSPRFIAIENETLTAIESVEALNNTEVYDLAGRRVKNATNGLYILNGKKVIR